MPYLSTSDMNITKHYANLHNHFSNKVINTIINLLSARPLSQAITLTNPMASRIPWQKIHEAILQILHADFSKFCDNSAIHLQHLQARKFLHCSS